MRFGFNGFGFNPSPVRATGAIAQLLQIPFDAAFVALGDSLISQKSNAKGIDNPVALVVFDANGGFRPRPGADQGIGGQTTTQFLARVANTAKQRADVVFLDGGTNDISQNATNATISGNDDAICAAIWAENPAAIIVRIGVHVATPQASKASQIADLNAMLAAKQKTTGATNRYLFVPIPAGYDGATWTSDGTHWNAYGARQIANAIKAVIAPYIQSGDLYASAAAYGPYGANLDTNTGLAGTAGTVTGLQSGSQVATGKVVSFTGFAGGTVSASKGTLGGATSQVITISATNATSAGSVKFNGSISGVAGTQGMVFEHFAHVRISNAAGNGPPIGMKNMWETLGNLGFHFSSTASGSDDQPAIVEGSFRVWPETLIAASSSLNPDINVLTGTGAVDIRVEITMPRLRRTELTTYAPPFYLGGDGIKSATNTLRITGTAGVGNVLTGGFGTWSGGGITFAPQWYRDGAAISGATSLTYTQVADDSGHTLTFGANASNALGSDNTSRSAGVAVP